MSRRTPAHDPTTRRRPAPARVDVARPDPRAWAAALRIARGEVRRLSVEKDGSVVVHNRPLAR